MADQAVFSVAVEAAKYASKSGVMPYGVADKAAKASMVAAAVVTFVVKVFLWGVK